MAIDYQQRKQLVNQALTAALKIRREIPFDESFDIFDFCAFKKDIDVRFIELPSMEGMYLANEDAPAIMLSSLRPMGRQYYNCAHEYGHHVFGHGISLDELSQNSKRYTPDEFLVDTFAGFLLMPKSLVNNNFVRRKWSIKDLNPIQFYTIASNIGVGYSTLIKHSQMSLNLIAESDSYDLNRIKPKDIREEILGFDTNSNVLVVDFHWKGRAADIQVDDFLVLPKNIEIEGDVLSMVGETYTGLIAKAIKPGRCRVHALDDSWAIYCRVRKKNFVGISKFRHDEDPEYDNQ